LKSLGPLVSQF